MRIATWNVNSLKVRMPRVEEWLDYAQPDVLCMQETKMADSQFPAMAFSALGYESVHHGDGRWNGVAILSKVGIEQPVFGFCEGVEADQDTRLVTAVCGGIHITSVYVPNGRSIQDPHYEYKLSWLERLLTHLERTVTRSDDVIVCGDFNVAPEDRDVWDPKKFIGSTHVTEPERKAVRQLEEWGLHDALRARHQEDKLYTYWDYRAGDFHNHRGMRIDLMLLSESLLTRLEWVLIDRFARKGKLPSDHAPLFVDLAAHA